MEVEKKRYKRGMKKAKLIKKEKLKEETEENKNVFIIIK